MGSLGPTEINQKISDMLAATEALKPKGSQASSPPTAKNSRKISKVFSKVSNAWDRLNQKSSSSDSKDADTSSPVSPASHASPSSIRSVDIRKNEGINIGKNEKARRIAGIEINRRPVPSSARSFQPSSANKPEANPYPTPPSVESPPYIIGNVDSVGVAPRPTSAFITDVRFDSDLEDRILSMSPDGSSTPHRHIRFGGFLQGARPAHMNHSRSHSSMSWRQSSAKSTISVTDVTRNLVVSTERIRKRRSADIGNAMDTYSPGTQDDRKRMKKHPSPDKRYLEFLKTVFQHYKTLKNSGAGEEEMDELASRFEPPSKYLAVRDSNNLLKGHSRASLEAEARVVKPRRPLSTMSTTNGSHISIFDENMTNDEFLGPRYRPQDIDADRTDELQ